MPDTGHNLGLCKPLLLIGILSAFVLVGFTWTYARVAPPWLETLDTSVGEILMDEGIRLEEAGAVENAKERYRLALDSRFEGARNRTYTQFRLGGLLWQEGDWAQAAELLRPAVALPHQQLSAFEPLADCLFRLERYAECAQLTEPWIAAAEAAGNAESVASALYYVGQLAAAAGDIDGAIAAYRRGIEALPGGRNASMLAHHYYNRGDYPRALQYADTYLQHGGAGDRATYMRNLRTWCLERMKS